jgi:hypothetical protein
VIGFALLNPSYGDCDTDTPCCTMRFPSPAVGHLKAGDELL